MDKIKVLLVDDEPSVLRALERVLQSKPDAKLDVTPICDSREAARIAETESNFDLLITDVRMTPLDGLGLIDIVKRAIPDIKIIVISAYLNEEMISQITAKGCNAFIRKPFRMAEIFEAVDAAFA